MLYNKKGQGLSMTMIVVIILAVLVLAVVALIFLGGSTGLAGRLRSIFVPQQAIAVDLARQTCEQWCSFAEGLSDDAVKTSSYCTAIQKGVDVNRDGNPDKNNEDKLESFVCDASNYNSPEAAESLSVKCGVQCR